MKPGKPFRFPLPFDPLRLLLAFRDHGLALIILTGLALAGGGALGYKLFKKNTYTVSAMLRKTTEAEGISIFGPEGYTPAMLRDQALEEIAFGHSIMKMLGEEFDPPETIEQLRKRLSIRYDAQQKLFYLEAKGPTERLSIVIANRWSELVIDHAKELMRKFASKDVATLKKDLERLDEKLIPINERIKVLSEEEAIIDDEAAFAALNTEILGLEKEMRDYEVQAQIFGPQMKQIVAALMKNHPLHKMRDNAEDKLGVLRAEGKTDRDPIVGKLNDTIAALDKRIAAEISDPPTDDQILEVGRVEGAQILFEQYLKLKQDKLRFERGTWIADAKLIELRDRMKQLPQVANKFRELEDDRVQLLTTRNAFDTRLQQAETYAGDQTKGYLEALQVADYGMADLSTGKYKTIASGLLLAGLVFGSILIWSILREIRRPQLRTMLQGAITTRATPALGLLQKDELDDESAVREFWLSHVAKKEEGGRRILFPIVGELKSEFSFWKTLLQSIKQDNALVLFIDVAQEPVPESFLKANLLPFSPSGNNRPTASSFLQGGGTSSEELWKGGSSGAAGGTALIDQPQVSSALSTNLMPDDQPIIPHAGDVSQSARYVSAADYSTEKLARLLQDLPPHYYVICRWAIGPTSSLTSIAKDFDQHFLLNSPVTTQKKVAASQSRIFRRILGTPSGILFLNEPVKGFFINLIHKIESRYFAWRSDSSPKPSKRDKESEDDDL